MSTEQEQVRLLAERIARRVSEDKSVNEVNEPRAQGGVRVGDELAAMRASLEELQKRLAQIESHVTRKGDDASQAGRGAQKINEQGSAQQQSQQSKPVSGGLRSPWLSGVYFPATHPSQERFGVEEATISELVDFFEGEKKCELEPGGKPCDHCAMCSTRGF
jgi:hypothetical protein